MKLLKILSTGFILFVALIFLAVAMGTFLAPGEVMEYLKFEPTADSAFNSIRASYGGLSLAISIFLFYASFEMRKTGLGLIVLYMTGFLFGRGYSILVEGMPSPFVIQWTLVEAILLIVSFILIRSLIKMSKEQRSLNMQV